MFTSAPQASHTTQATATIDSQAPVASVQVSLPAAPERQQLRTISYTHGHYTSPQRRIRGRYITRVE